MKQVEKDLWLNLVIQHPDGLYGNGMKEEDEDAANNNGTPGDDAEGETIANSKFNYSQFTEDDSQIFYLLLEQYYNYYKLLHGSLIEQVSIHSKSGTL